MMTKEANLMIMLFASMVSPLMGSCPENTHAMFCDGGDFAPQVYCNDVDLTPWQCTKKRKVWCGCSAGFARAKHGTCVRTSQCSTINDVRKLYPLATNTPSDGNHKDTDEQASSSGFAALGEKALELVQLDKDIYLVKASSEVEINHECVCLKSAFSANLTHGAVRTVECYYYIATKPGHGSRAVVFSNQTIINRPHYANFVVSNRDGQTFITVGSTQLPNTVTHINKNKLHFHGKFEVLDAQDTCLLVAFAERSDGKPICMLWTVDAQAQEESNQCLATLLSKCTGEVYNLMEHLDECKKYDASEKRKLEKENMEILNLSEAS